MADLDLDRRLSAAVATANDAVAAQPDRFEMILERVIERLPHKGARAFTESEETKLANALGLGDAAATVRAMVDMCEATYRRAVAKGLKPDGLGDPLARAGGSEALVGAFQRAWRAHGQRATKAMRALPFGAPQYVESVRWQVQVPLAGTDDASASGPGPDALLGTMDLTLAGGDPAASAAARRLGLDENGKEALAVEFTRDELWRMFERMEEIQAHLDNLS